jgi:hypothetical protein
MRRVAILLAFWTAVAAYAASGVLLVDHVQVKQPCLLTWHTNLTWGCDRPFANGFEKP